MKGVIGSLLIILIIVGLILFAAFPIWRHLQKSKELGHQLRLFAVLDIIASIMLLIMAWLCHIIPGERLRFHYGDMSWVIFVEIMALIFAVIMIFVSLVSWVYILKSYKTLHKTSSSNLGRNDLVWLGLGAILVIIVIVSLVTTSMLRLSW